MVSTHPPCGDATTFVKDIEKSDAEKYVIKEDVPPCKKAKLVLNRTGSKLSASNPISPGLGRYHKVGQVRTKPGRGERSLSLSYSDKIIKWNIVGIQGA